MGPRDGGRNRGAKAGQEGNWNRSRSLPALPVKKCHCTLFYPPTRRNCASKPRLEVGSRRVPRRDKGRHNALPLGNGDVCALKQQGFQSRKMGSQLANGGRFHRDALLRHNAFGVNCNPLAPRRRQADFCERTAGFQPAWVPKRAGCPHHWFAPRPAPRSQSTPGPNSEGKTPVRGGNSPSEGLSRLHAWAHCCSCRRTINSAPFRL